MRRRMMLNQARLPSEYQEVEWIGSGHGGQSIATNYVPKINPSLETDIACIIDRTGDLDSWGFMQNNVPSFIFNFYPDFSNECIYLYVRYYYTASAWQGYIWLDCPLTNFIHIKHSNELIIGTHHLGTQPIQSFEQNTQQLYLFRGRNFQAQKMKETIIKDGNIVVRHMIPCYRKSDNEVGMYDLCESICPLTNTSFYTNAGTGTFTKGSDVL